MEKPDPMVVALRALAERVDGGYKSIAQAAHVSADNLWQIINGTLLPSGKPRGVGPQLRKKLAEAFPDWLEPVSLGNTERGPDLSREVPLISWVTAGHWTEVVDNFQPGDAEEWIPSPARHGPRAYALRVRGQSMYNPGGEISFKENDLIIVEPDRHAVHKSLVIVRLETDKEATFKQLIIEGERRYLVALNPNWPNRIIEINGDATLCGVVISKVEMLV